MSDELFFRLRTLLTFEITSFEGRLQQLLAEHYPTDTAPALIRQLLLELENTRGRIQQIVGDLSADPKGAYARLRSEHRTFHATYFPYVVYLQSAQTRRVPWSLVPSIERLANQLLPGRRLLTTCLDEFNYRLIWDDTHSLGISRASLDDFDILLIPSSQRLNAFLHMLVGHELFHPLLGDFLDNEQALVSAGFRASSETWLANQLTPSDPLFQGRLDQIVEMVRTIWRDAMAELMCDLGCVRLFGPAAVLAFSSFISGQELDTAPTSSPFYPPNRFRLRTMLHHGFGPSGYSQEFEDFVSVLESTPEIAAISQQFMAYWRILEDLVRDDTDVKAVNVHPFLSFAYAEIDEPLQRACEFINSIPLAHGTKWRDSYWHVPSHLSRVVDHVPCGELPSVDNPCGTASRISSIATAAWLNELYSQSKRHGVSEAELYEEYFRDCRLLLKSLEDSELKRTFAEKIVPHPQVN